MVVEQTAQEAAWQASNARAESVADKPMFRDAFERHRWIIAASGYYE